MDSIATSLSLPMIERIPFPAAAGSEAYDAIRKIPAVALLENVRSLYNVGSFFRTADAAGLEKLYLSGITGTPPHKGIAKTALGAEETVLWEHVVEPLALLDELAMRHYEIVAIETSSRAVDLFDWQPSFPVCLLFGHETDGLSPEVLDRADRHVRIPMLGMKHSLNVGIAGGVVIYDLLRKYRNLHMQAQQR